MTGGELGLAREIVTQALTMASIVPERRAETLSVEEFKALGKAVWQIHQDT